MIKHSREETHSEGDEKSRDVEETTIVFLDQKERRANLVVEAGADHRDPATQQYYVVKELLASEVSYLRGLESMVGPEVIFFERLIIHNYLDS
jgi:hypothetical protein